MRERGLKLLKCLEHKKREGVAPHAGAWIETGPVRPKPPVFLVAPHAGAWIETMYFMILISDICVAPHAGAWIETAEWLVTATVPMSLPMRERGLKQK